MQNGEKSLTNIRDKVEGLKVRNRGAEMEAIKNKNNEKAQKMKMAIDRYHESAIEQLKAQKKSIEAELS